MFHWRRQPPFDVEQRPFTRHVLPDSPQQEFMVDIIKQTFDIELQDPIIFPAPLTRNAHSIERRLLRPVATGVCQEYLVQIPSAGGARRRLAESARAPRVNAIFDKAIGVFGHAERSEPIRNLLHSDQRPVVGRTKFSTITMPQFTRIGTVRVLLISPLITRHFV
jgi:hypothetical protein